ncbi:MAG TPA: hypothetical protein EYO59_11925 [Chromatiaceae bacterium]|nr:hypothetical protein [Chromatiaceae bacterium]
MWFNLGILHWVLGKINNPETASPMLYLFLIPVKLFVLIAALLLFVIVFKMQALGLAIGCASMIISIIAALMHQLMRNANRKR